MERPTRGEPLRKHWTGVSNRERSHGLDYRRYYAGAGHQWHEHCASLRFGKAADLEYRTATTPSWTSGSTSWAMAGRSLLAGESIAALFLILSRLETRCVFYSAAISRW
jgi:hypothetical protein